MKETRRRQPQQCIEDIRYELSAIVADGGDGAVVQVKILKAQTLFAKLENIQTNLAEREFIKHQLGYLSQDNKYQYGSLKAMEQRMEERYHEHHGRVIKKHVSIREQDDILRTLKRKMLHQRISLVEERRVIKDLKLAEETRLVSIIEYNDIDYSNCMYKERKENIKACRDEIIQRRVAMKKMRARFEDLDREFKSGETELMKLKELKGEIQNYISFLPFTLHGHYP